MPVITLVGYRGTGKSTVAAAVADRLGCDWVDADAVLEERVGTSIASLVRERGETTFRDEESTILAELLASCAGVLSTGGGAVLRPLNRGRLRALGRPVVWLTASCAVIRRRLAADPHTASRRPGLAGADPLDEIDSTVAHRAPLYREVADAMIDTGASGPEDVTRRILEWLAAGAEPGRLWEEAC